MSQTASELIAQHLSGAGCRHAFGMPGGEVLLLMDALENAGITFTLCKHENAAGYMAEGSWHATGAPGLLLTTVGPGLANAVNSIANAFQEQVPLIVLSGCIDAGEAEQFTHQVIDQTALLAPVTKATFRVADGTAAHVVQKALAVAMADPPGPVHIDLPVGLAGATQPEVTLTARATHKPGWPDEASLADAARQLETAERPLILAGLGALLHDAGAAITEMAQARNIPVVTTYKAKGVMDETHPLALGGHGLSPVSDTDILPLVGDSDCLLLAGYDPIEMRSGWIQPWAAQNAIEMLHADTNHGVHASRLRVVGDVAKLIAELNAAAAPQANDSWADGAAAAARSSLETAFAPRDRWGPHAVFDTLGDWLPDNGVITVDSGAHRILISQMLKMRTPRSLLQSSAFCTMGVSVPLGIGHAIAAPTRPVVSVVGDAGFQMSPGDLSTLNDSGVRMAIVVLVDDSLALIEKKQAGMQLPLRGVTFGRSDLVGIAQAYGGRGHLVRDADALRAALETSLTAPGFTLIACEIDKQDYNGAF